MKLKISVLAAAAAAFLSACGGGGDDETPSTPQTSSVSTNVATNVAALGATTISEGLVANEVAYDLVASIGDTWRVIVNTSTNKARVKVLASDHGLTDTAEVAVTKTTSGDQEIWTGTGIDVRVDGRTKNVTGKVTVGSKTSSVTGTGYAVSNTSSAVLGDYAFAGMTTCYQAGSNAPTSNPTCTDTVGGRDVVAGTLRVKAGGVLLICPAGVIASDTTCTDPTNDSNPGFEATPSSATVSAEGVITANSVQWGRLKVVPGDLGTVLMIDRAGPNSGGGYSTGVIGARKLTALSGTEFDGSWTCTNGSANYGYTVSGTTATASSGSASGQGSLAYNKVGVGDSPSSMPSLNGLIATYSGNEGPYDIILPLSSSFAMIIKTETGSLTDLKVCGKV